MSVLHLGPAVIAVHLTRSRDGKTALIPAATNSHAGSELALCPKRNLAGKIVHEFTILWTITRT